MRGGVSNRVVTWCEVEINRCCFFFISRRPCSVTSHLCSTSSSWSAPARLSGKRCSKISRRWKRFWESSGSRTQRWWLSGKRLTAAASQSVPPAAWSCRSRFRSSLTRSSLISLNTETKRVGFTFPVWTDNVRNQELQKFNKFKTIWKKNSRFLSWI